MPVMWPSRTGDYSLGKSFNSHPRSPRRSGLAEGAFQTPVAWTRFTGWSAGFAEMETKVGTDSENWEKFLAVALNSKCERLVKCYG